MRFSVVETGYDQRQVDSCLDQLDLRLTRLAARAERAALAGREWDQVRQEALALRRLVGRPTDPADVDRAAVRRGVPAVQREAAQLLDAARREFGAAREEARQLRERVYAEAVQARRDLELVLAERRRRAELVDRLLDGATVPVDAPTAAAGVPVSRAVGAGAEEPAGGTRAA
ncbi:hypothetical protein [Micromonospora mirobrigensis]|uniref:Uncharacterized protein n=1 Tax=Micromonospora mirobrigensis TaxID=262898 RepID=A0A1C4YTC8_9ACTN|nr:hypothetical protein [Micromonospora mirobrigensis]SCF23920.1 hypothetical protein GA0070564_104358 [Micromonospora mirobrigensis]